MPVETSFSSNVQYFGGLQFTCTTVSKQYEYLKVVYEGLCYGSASCLINFEIATTHKRHGCLHTCVQARTYSHMQAYYEGAKKDLKKRGFYAVLIC